MVRFSLSLAMNICKQAGFFKYSSDEARRVIPGMDTLNTGTFVWLRGSPSNYLNFSLVALHNTSGKPLLLWFQVNQCEWI